MPTPLALLPALLTAGGPPDDPPCPIALPAPADLDAEDAFGSAVALQAGRALIGARGAQDAGESSGAVYAFAWTPEGWFEEAKLLPDDLAEEDRFGTSVALWDDVAIITALRDDDAGDKSGSAYVFAREGNQWVQAGKLEPSDLGPGDELGTVVAIHDGSAAIGAWKDDDSGVDAGAAYLFRETDAGAWVETAKLLPPDGAAGDRFGWNVSIQGGTAAVSNLPLAQVKPGSVYLFQLGSDGWQFTQKLTAAGPGDGFGSDLALDGDTLLVGADGASSAAGRAYAFERGGDGLWVETAQLIAADGQAGDRFGIALDLDGDRAVIGARAADGSAIDSGRAYVFERVGGAWGEGQPFAPAIAHAGDQFGYWVALDDNHTLIGARASDVHQLNGGAAHLFGLDGCNLYGAPAFVSVADGGAQTLALDFGPDRAGEPYLLLGSAAGTSFGPQLGSSTLPLTPDAYTSFTLDQPNSPPLTDSFGLLDAHGVAVATFVLPSGSSPGLAGLTLHHAGLALGGSNIAVSNPFRLRLVP